ncbi:MAG: prepilin-type N-terminal cleavage/methylation domain-containing protein, partial [Myxococcales bacterium]|nr:prepilin-type N-terminal cleavage/methylation domain-containing protein [Myxococcales bacterium]
MHPDADHCRFHLLPGGKPSARQHPAPMPRVPHFRPCARRPAGARSSVRGAAGFTLIELMVVSTIIGILAA